MPRLKSIIFYQNSPKLKLFLQKNAKFSSTGGSAVFFFRRGLFTTYVNDAKMISLYFDRTSLHALIDRLYAIILSTVSVKKQLNQHISKHYQRR